MTATKLPTIDIAGIQDPVVKKAMTAIKTQAAIRVMYSLVPSRIVMKKAVRATLTRVM